MTQVTFIVVAVVLGLAMLVTMCLLVRWHLQFSVASLLNSAEGSLQMERPQQPLGTYTIGHRGGNGRSIKRQLETHWGTR